MEPHHTLRRSGTRLAAGGSPDDRIVPALARRAGAFTAPFLVPGFIRDGGVKTAGTVP